MVSRSCPICGQSHDELVALLAQAELRRIPSRELLEQEEWAETELTQLTAEGRLNGQYRDYVAHSKDVAEKELTRRRNLRRYGAPPVPGKGPYSAEFIQELKRRVDLAELLESFGILVYKLEHSGRRRYRCPIHGVDRTPSGVIFGREQRWWCFGCNCGGDAIAACYTFKGMDFRQAIEYLANYACIPLPDKGAANDQKEN